MNMVLLLLLAAALLGVASLLFRVPLQSWAVFSSGSDVHASARSARWSSSPSPASTAPWAN